MIIKIAVELKTDVKIKTKMRFKIKTKTKMYGSCRNKSDE